MRGGLDACVSKPVRQSQLLSTLVGAWDRRHAAHPPTDPPEPAGAADRKAPLRTASTAENCRILVVEDNVVNQVVASRLLARLGLHSDLAANGREAVEMAALRPYDLILMDCQVPEMDGFEATRLIRGLAGDAGRVTVIAMTADARQGTRETCLAAGMDDNLAKPVNLQGLRELLQRWLQQIPLDSPLPAASRALS